MLQRLNGYQPITLPNKTRLPNIGSSPVSRRGMALYNYTDRASLRLSAEARKSIGILDLTLFAKRVGQKLWWLGRE